MGRGAAQVKQSGEHNIGCNDKTNGINAYFTDCESCTVRSEGNFTCIACLNGFVYTDSNDVPQCVNKCPYKASRYVETESGGTYGVTTFKERGYQSKSYCSGKYR